ncbi:MAG: class I SAM-dependent methyltransferase [Hyphomicrobiales bacterium]|nr:class I SAM-dependent methyltransferase [Hyphomicrobiales bacterium]MBV9433172.1 class I SAM-dependent methyltransferase [Hyphomicrobiales bacterium]
MTSSKTWREFWEGDTPIYVSERHKILHYRLIARDILRAIDALPEAARHEDASHADAAAASFRPVVLDQGCGEALSAGEIAARCERLYLCDAAASVRARLQARFARIANIVVINPVEVADIPEGTVDLVVANSLAQYLARSELVSALRLWRELLKPQGRLLLADVPARGVSPMTDALALLRFGWRGGFLLAALAGLARTAVSDYRKLRAELGFASYDETQMLALLSEAGFSARRQIPNFGHNQARMAFLAKPV